VPAVAAVAGVLAAAVGLFVVSETGLDGLLDWPAETAATGLPLHASVALGLVAVGVLLLRGRRRLAAEHRSGRAATPTSSQRSAERA